MAVNDGPDFICVGMPKAGTGWLYDQLEAHPDFWMPPVKELVYLGSRYPSLRFAKDRKLARHDRKGAEEGEFVARERRGGRERRVHRFTFGERDRAFLKRARTGRGKPMDLEFYASLFEFKDGQISGDITPPYCDLQNRTISEIARRFPATKILLFVRDPVARTWSRICMSHAGRGFDTGLLSDADAFRAHLQSTHILGGLFATKVYERWRRRAAGMDVRILFFDDLVSCPERLRRDVLVFLGADPDKKSGDIPPNYNRKAKTKLEMTPLARQVLVDHFRKELEASAKVFGGPARGWAAVYGL